MIFIRTVIENFFSISSEVIWEMENQGLVLIYGENHDSQTADSNGAGKSTLFEALVWALWGKTSRGQNNDAVVNRKTKKDCRVEVSIQHDGDLYRIVRYRNHHTEKNGLQFEHFSNGNTTDLSQGTSTLTQDKINAFLGIDYDTFIQGPMIPQSHFKRFSEMSDSEQKSIFDKALQTEILAAAESETKKQISIVTQSLTTSTALFNRIEFEICTLQLLVKDYVEKKNNWNKQKIKSLCSIEKNIVYLIEEQETIFESIKAVNLDQELTDAKYTIIQLRQKRDDLQKEWYKQQSVSKDHISDLKATWKEITSNVRVLQSEIRNMENLSGASCPTCGQDVPQKYVDSCLKGSRTDLETKSKAALELANKINVAETKLAADETVSKCQIRDSISNISEHEDKYTAIMEETSAAKSWIKEFEALIRQESSLREVFRKKQIETTPFNSMISEAETSIAAKQKSLVKVKASVRQAQIQLEHLEFWKYGFSNKGLKSHILASVTPFLNERAEHHINALSGGELKIEFSTQTTLKTGETREKFSVQVTNKNGADTYAGNSGGEKGRADIAINFCLSDLMASRASRPYPQRFLDEPFENLDESGVEAVVELLSDMATDAGSIFVITHQESMKGMFARTLKLIKKNGITTLVAS